MIPPIRLLVPSDANVMEYVETLKANASKKTAVMYVYRYTVSKSKLNSTLSVTEIQLKKMIDKQWVIDIS